MSWLTSTAWQLMRRFSETSPRAAVVVPRSRRAVPFPVVIALAPCSLALGSTEEGARGEGQCLLAGLADERFGIFVNSGQRHSRERGRRRSRPYSACRLLAAIFFSTPRLLDSSTHLVAHDGDLSRGAADAHPALLDGATVDVERRFFVLRRATGAEVVGRLETLPPGRTVEIAQDATGRLGDVEIEGLPHIDPLLAASGGGDQPGGVDLEGGRIALFDLVWDARDGLHRTVVIFQIVEHLGVPQSATGQVAHQPLVDDGELPGEIALDVEVRVERLDRLANSLDVGNRGGGSDGHRVAVAHAVRAHGRPHRFPVEGGTQFDINWLAPLRSQKLHRINRKETPVPLRTGKGGIRAALFGQFG